MSVHAWEMLSNRAVATAAVFYFLALLSHLVEWSALIGRRRTGHVTAEERALVNAGDVNDIPAAPPAGVTPVEESRAERIAMFGRLGYLLTCFAALAHLTAVVSRGIAAHRVPWGNMYEFTVAGTCIVALAYVLLYARLKLAWMAPAVVAFVLVILMVGVLVLYDPVDWEAAGQERGTPFSLAHTFTQTGPFRPANLERRAPGLVPQSHHHYDH